MFFYLRQEILRNSRVYSKHRNGKASRLFTSQLEARDVDLVISQKGAEVSNHTRLIVVRKHKHVTLGHHLHFKRIDLHDSRLFAVIKNPRNGPFLVAAFYTQ